MCDATPTAHLLLRLRTPLLRWLHDHSSFLLWSRGELPLHLHCSKKGNEIGAHGAGLPQQPHGGGPCGPLRLAARGACKGSHAKRAESALRPSLRLLPLPALTLPQFFLPPYVYVSVWEKEERGCLIIRNLAEKYPAKGGEHVNSGLRWMALFATLVSGAQWDTLPPSDGVIDGCSCARLYGDLQLLAKNSHMTTLFSRVDSQLDVSALERSFKVLEILRQVDSEEFLSGCIISMLNRRNFANWGSNKLFCIWRLWWHGPINGNTVGCFTCTLCGPNVVTLLDQTPRAEW